MPRPPVGIGQIPEGGEQESGLGELGRFPDGDKVGGEPADLVGLGRVVALGLWTRKCAGHRGKVRLSGCSRQAAAKACPFGPPHLPDMPHRAPD